MHDLKAIRQDPAAFDKAMARRKLPAQSPKILSLDEERRAVQTELQTLQSERNEKSKLIGQIKGKGGDASSLMDEVNGLKDRMTGLEERDVTLGKELTDILSGLPNILFDEVPDGADENDNVEVRKVGEPKRGNSEAKDHTDIGAALGMMDFDVAAKMSGARFVLMSAGLARLERALAQLMLDTHTTEHGYTEVSPPLLVKDNAVYGTGQLPKFEGDLFKTSKLEHSKIDFSKAEAFLKKDTLADAPDDVKSYESEQKIKKENLYILLNEAIKEAEESFYLIPTAEVSLTNIVADEIVDEETLPRRYTAFTPCFRSEAGAAGKDTKGMIRQHQFYKVEMVSVVKPEDSEAEHERMTACAENILKKLKLPFRTITLCSGDTGFGARKTYDIEVWLPGQDRYREISSCSNCGEFQARRMNARYKPKGEKATKFVHTLNGSGLAVGRTLIAVLENYYDPADGGVFVPDALKPYMGGLEKILPLTK